MSRLKKIKEEVAKKRAEALQPVDFSKGLSTGSKLLNLCCTGHITVGFLPGFYYRLIGSSRSGKTWLVLSALAEATINPAYDHYDLYYDPTEGGAQMDTRKYFGDEFCKRVQSPPQGISRTVEEFYYNLDDVVQNAHKTKRPFVYGLDSMDTLSSDAEEKKFQEQKTAYRKGTKIPGSYGDGKAKKNSSGLRPIIPALQETGSILLLISQSRDNIDTMSFKKETASGGRALTFYTTTQIWTSTRGQIVKTVRGNKVKIADVCRFHVDKTRIRGWDRSVDVSIYPSFGIDDVGSMVDWLLEWKHWKEEEGTITAPEIVEEPLSREELIQRIDTDDTRELERLLGLTVAQVWAQIEEESSIHRRNRYD